MIIYTHNDCLKKFNGHNHPERKERLESILSSIKSSNLKIALETLIKYDLARFQVDATKNNWTMVLKVSKGERHFLPGLVCKAN